VTSSGKVGRRPLLVADHEVEREELLLGELSGLVKEKAGAPGRGCRRSRGDPVSAADLQRVCAKAYVMRR
jgi:hypothetical protein